MGFTVDGELRILVGTPEYPHEEMPRTLEEMLCHDEPNEVGPMSDYSRGRMPDEVARVRDPNVRWRMMLGEEGDPQSFVARSGAHHITMRTRIRRRAPLKLAPLLITQDHLVWRLLRHRPQDSARLL